MWLLIASLAQIILGTSAVFDKLLLKRKIFDPWAYTFWLGVLGAFALLLAPFGSFFIPPKALVIALVAGAIFIFAMLALFEALSKSHASIVLPAIGGLSPVLTLILAFFVFNGKFNGMDAIGFLFLILGSAAFFLTEERELKWHILSLVIFSAFFFGISNVLSKIVFESAPFIPAFIWIKMGGVCAVLSLLLIPSLRKKIFHAHAASGASHNAWYLANRGYAAIGSLLVSFAISLAHPALVDATQSLKFAVIFIASGIFLKEHIAGKMVWKKILATFLIIAGLVWLGLVEYAREIPVDTVRPITWGVTFSSKFSRALGLDWQKNFEAIVTELHPKKIRLVAYWDEIEKTRGEFDFSELDWQIQKSQEANIPVILAVGMKMPRWPECHIPAWAREIPIQTTEAKPPYGGLASVTLEEHLRDYIKVVINRYKNHPALAVWQIENEPFLRFGKCVERGENFLQKEIALVKSLDPSHPILVTDSGEFGLWYRAIRAGDIFGTTMYRKVYPPSVGRWTGIFQYPLSPAFFRFKTKLLRLIAGEQDKKFIVIELQGEPWGSVEIPLLSGGGW
ncbi:MAG: Uncharacterized protein G01um101433_894 [Parcubacteria group bacterium Gr01-1014_33]|nr:MAG: Uncharacterized protein G01um101433_894 [Parcubacteria group bacterium Gr01-1014_33]